MPGESRTVPRMSDGPKKILYLNRVSEIGGAEVSLQALAENLPRKDFAPVVVVGSPGTLSKRFKALNIPVYELPSDRLRPGNPISFIKTIRFLLSIIKKEKITLVHTNATWDNHFGVVAAKIARIPHILHVRGFSKANYSRKSLFSLGDVAICNSAHTREQFIAYSGFKKRTEVVHNGIDSEVLKPDPEKRKQMRDRYGFKDTDTVMGMAGRLAEEKGQFPLLEALLPRLKANKTYKVLVTGNAVLHPGSDYEGRINAFITDNKLETQVRLAGFVDDMPGFYNALDLFLHPAFREPFGRVVIEAMAAGKPVIASKVGGIPEIISDDSSDGVLVEPGHWDTWLEKIDLLIRDPETAMRMARQGREKVIKQFSLAAQMDRIVAIYKSLIG